MTNAAIIKVGNSEKFITIKDSPRDYLFAIRRDALKTDTLCYYDILAADKR